MSDLSGFSLEWDYTGQDDEIDKSLLMPTRQGDPAVMIAELNDRLRVRMREVQVLKNALQRYGADDKQISLHTHSHLTALGAKDAKIRNLEAKVKGLERQVKEKEEAIRSSRMEIAAMEDEVLHVPEKQEIAMIINTEVQKLKEDILKERGLHSERTKQQSEETEKLVKQVVRMKSKMKERAQQKRARYETMERDLMETQDTQMYLEQKCALMSDSLKYYQSKENRNNGERTNYQMTLFEEIKERFILDFGPSVKMVATNDEYIEQLVEKSYFKNIVTSLKEEMQEWVHQASTRQDQCVKALWTLIDRPTSSKQPRKDAFKSITEMQRKHKLHAAELARKVNNLLKTFVEVEKTFAKNLVTSHEVEKMETRTSEGTMCVIPDPPAPIVQKLKRSLDMAQNDKQLYMERNEHLQKERDELEADLQSLITQTYDLHVTLYHTFKTVWTHRYRFTEFMEDPAREIVPKKGRKLQTTESLRKIFSVHTEKVLNKDKDMLNTFKEYITSDDLYKKDIMALARQKREEEARRKNIEAGYALHIKKDEYERRASVAPAYAFKKKDYARSPRGKSCFGSEGSPRSEKNMDYSDPAEVTPFHMDLPSPGPESGAEAETDTLDASVKSGKSSPQQSPRSPRTPHTPHTPRTEDVECSAPQDSPAQSALPPQPAAPDFARTPSVGSPVSSLRKRTSSFFLVSPVTFSPKAKSR
eukprot:TRINITY_DN14509_c0_g1_i1.p1 TRINITY_DN14509_c0_g1~~TRINITY_DN14509_c0_g1_i1.p1  ORF type:complete len:702 (+),score=252.26 TRINITY_DN14509_c0_g1_i1:167-2272(+)